MYLINEIYTDSSLFYSLAIGFTITLFLIPLIVYMAKSRNILYWPDKRSSHMAPTPALGGIAIFLGFIIPFLIFSKSSTQELIMILSSSTIIFILGLIDDLRRIKPIKKLVIILMLAFLLSSIEGMTISNLCGVLSIFAIPLWVSILITILVIVFTVNAINLLDGIDGLAGGLGILVLFIFSWYFAIIGKDVPLQLNLSLIAALSAFLIYNLWSRKYKIFMGDSGSLLLGLILSINLITYFRFYDEGITAPVMVHPLTIVILFIVPGFDFIHVAVKRMLMKRSPFHPDRNHIHHTFLKLGLSHQEASLVLILYTLFFFFLSKILIIYLNSLHVITLVIILAILFWHVPEMIIRSNPRKYALKRNRYKNGKVRF
jgi:UDP-GlcNAc:undecaprenyl-phosphate/decaprenyl-phosphate GlcNAc-1-phosphate transferase